MKKLIFVVFLLFLCSCKQQESIKNNNYVSYEEREFPNIISEEMLNLEKINITCSSNLEFLIPCKLSDFINIGIFFNLPENEILKNYGKDKDKIKIFYNDIHIGEVSIRFNENPLIIGIHLNKNSNFKLNGLSINSDISLLNEKYGEPYAKTESYIEYFVNLTRIIFELEENKISGVYVYPTQY